jgi:hypothetical protein
VGAGRHRLGIDTFDGVESKADVGAFLGLRHPGRVARRWPTPLAMTSQFRLTLAAIITPPEVPSP